MASTTTSALAARIEEALRQRPGMTAAEIGSKLGTSRGDVNRVLYGELKERVGRTSDYRWSLSVPSGDTRARRASGDPRVPAEGPLSRLCSYYLDCLVQQDE